MVPGSRIDGDAQVLSAGVRKTIQSIKEIVGNHSDFDIYVALKEANMNPNETIQKLLNQDPFHEVKRKRDRKKENSAYKSTVPPETAKNAKPAHLPLKYNSYSDRNVRRPGFSRNAVPDAGGSREFRVVRDNRVNQIACNELKPAQNSILTSKEVISNGPIRSNSSGPSGYQKSPIDRHSSQGVNGPTDSHYRQINDSSGNSDRKEQVVEKRVPIHSAASRVQTKANDHHLPSANSSSSSVVGLYPSSSDPVHVPSIHSRPAANVGAIRREVGVVGPRRLSSDNSAKPSASQNTSFSTMQAGRESHSRDSARSFSGISKSDQASHSLAPESTIAGLSVSRSVSNNQYNNRPHQPMGHQKAPQPNKEWKPKSSLKSSASGTGDVGSPKNVSPQEGNTEEFRKEVVQMSDSLSRLNMSENQNVIIAAHIRVSERDRVRLTFGSLGAELDSSTNLVLAANNVADESSTEPSISVSGSAPESSGDDPSGSKPMMDDSVRSSGSNSPVSDTVLDHQVTEKKESSSPHNLENCVDVGLVRDLSMAYSPESLQQQDVSELPRFSGYDPQVAYDMPYFRPMVDETMHVPGLPSSQEVLSSHTTATMPASTIAMVQQQLAQMYPQLHVPHYTNLMPYRQFLSPVYVPPMPVPGYSNNPAYPHPTSGSSYLLMPGNSSHLTPGGVKYGIQQFKQVPSGSPTGFRNFTSPTGYAISAPGVVGSAAGHEDSSRLKYKDSLYVPNPQAETSEIWMNPRDVSSLQSASFYNMPGQTPNVYLPSHTGHASFNAATQSSHMQFPVMYHPTPQPAAIASPHHMGPAIGGNVSVGVAAPAPGAQVGAYQQPQLGHLNWTGNF